MARSKKGTLQVNIVTKKPSQQRLERVRFDNRGISASMVPEHVLAELVDQLNINPAKRHVAYDAREGMKRSEHKGVIVYVPPRDRQNADQASAEGGEALDSAGCDEVFPFNKATYGVITILEEAKKVCMLVSQPLLHLDLVFHIPVGDNVNRTMIV